MVVCPLQSPSPCVPGAPSAPRDSEAHPDPGAQSPSSSSSGNHCAGPSGSGRHPPPTPARPPPGSHWLRAHSDRRGNPYCPRWTAGGSDGHSLSLHASPCGLCQCPLARPAPFRAACSWIACGLLAQCPISSWVERVGREAGGGDRRAQVRSPGRCRAGRPAGARSLGGGLGSGRHGLRWRGARAHSAGSSASPGPALSKGLPLRSGPFMLLPSDRLGRGQGPPSAGSRRKGDREGCGGSERSLRHSQRASHPIPRRSRGEGKSLVRCARWRPSGPVPDTAQPFLAAAFPAAQARDRRAWAQSCLLGAQRPFLELGGRVKTIRAEGLRGAFQRAGWGGAGAAPKPHPQPRLTAVPPPSPAPCPHLKGSLFP